MNRVIALAVTVAALGASAQVATCEDQLGNNVQPPFAAGNMDTTTAMDITGANELKLNTALIPFDAEKIVLPVDQRLTVSYVYESAGATHAIGYLYYDDLISAGYIDTHGTADSSDDTLRDTNGNGVMDFHEDLYNVMPTAPSPQSRPYVGQTRRCTTQFTSGGFDYTVPELATNNGCASNLAAAVALRDANNPATWGPGPNINVDTIGASGPETANDYSDRGLFRNIPNLLEPADPANGNRGLGRIIFVHAEDDSDTNIWNGFSQITDATSVASNGIPDYDVSAYDATGRLRTVNPDIGITNSDRTVDLGMVSGNKELVFFMVAAYSPGHGGDRTYPCLRRNGANQCSLHLKSPVAVFFSKSRFNMDQNPNAANPAAIRNIGCDYAGGGGTGMVAGPAGSPYVGSNRSCWLDNATLVRLNTPAYNSLLMPAEAAVVPRPASGVMPHVLVGAPSTDPYRWIFGFEDLTGGGDRDFNDVVVMINKGNGGNARSATVSTEIAVPDANEMTVTKVRLKRVDDVSRGVWTEASPGACAGPPLPTIRYYIALDCRICGGGVCNRNPNPTWSEVVFPTGVNEVTVDTMSRGMVGSQLCWRVDMTSPRDTCTPVLSSLEVGYQAVRAGDYSRSVLIPLANTVMFGVYETPGQQWSGLDPRGPAPRPSWRTYDNKQDFSLRGHAYLRRLYDPDSATPTANDGTLLWDGAERLAEWLEDNKAAGDYLDRKLYTLDPDGSTATSVKGDRIELKNHHAMEEVLPSGWYNTQSLGKYPYDMNRSSAGNGPATDDDRDFIRDWLYGWEDRQGAASALCTVPGECKLQGAGGPVKRAWAMSGVQLSSPAIIAAPGTPSWFNFVSSDERNGFVTNFQEKLKNRRTVAFLGTMGGYLHALSAGSFRRGADPCTGTSYRGYFNRSPCTDPRDYGDGEELFAYLPHSLLRNYARNYIGELPGAGAPIAPAQINAPPSFGDVDFGIDHEPAWTIDHKGRPDVGAKSVLVAASGPLTDVVFALDVTDPSKASETDDDKLRWPIPLFEWRMDSVLPTWTSTPAPALTPDTTGSRHSPPIVKADFGANYEPRWITAIGTDFQPSAGSAGTVYLIDLITGAPVAFDHEGDACKRDRSKSESSDDCYEVGVLPFEQGEGIGGEPSAVDANGDGLYDLLYVPVTSGHVYRVNLNNLDRSRAIDRRISSCLVADAPTTLQAHGLSPAQALMQGLYSPLSIRVAREGSVSVDIFFGTADSPDDPYDDVATNYHLLAYRDETPTGACTASELWQNRLDPGQEVWGGVTLGASSVFAVTAVGTAADACNLSQTENGRLYSLAAATGTAVGGLPPTVIPPSVAGGTVYDEQFLFTTTTGELKASGSGKWNNQTQSGGAARRRSIMWQSLPPGKLP